MWKQMIIATLAASAIGFAHAQEAPVPVAEPAAEVQAEAPQAPAPVVPTITFKQSFNLQGITVVEVDNPVTCWVEVETLRCSLKRPAAAAAE